MKSIKELSVYRLPSTAKSEVGSRKSEDRFKNGFTLVEIIVVMAIVAIVGLIMVVIFTNTLRGSNKAQILSVIKQNGQAVLENMDKTVRSADHLVCPALDGNSSNTAVVVKNGAYIRYRISKMSEYAAGRVPPACQKNGCILQDSPTKDIDPGTGQLETDSAFILRVCNSTSLMSSANILTDTNSQTGVAVPGGFFTLSKQAGFKAAVTVEFELQPGADALSVVASQIDSVSFQTTIELR
ncbi:MAG: type II secretion system protein [Candidatus Daviesbacteria bacterium]|nr:type II secretion system protein [Candidatus Daviesbacteria bacterium]